MTTTVGTSEVTQFVDTHATIRFAWGDYIRVFGTLAVISQHIAQGTTLFGASDVSSVTWWGAMTFEASCRWAVPVFVMLSGALLLDPVRDEAPSDFYRKRFWRIGIPLLFWSLFYTLPRAAANGFDAPVMADIGTKLAHGRPAYHMYFLFVIAGLYLLTPYLRIIVRSVSRAQLRTVWVALILIAWGGELLNVCYGYRHTVLTEFVPYIGYFLAGFDLRHSRLSRRGTGLACSVVGLAIAVMVVVTVPLVDRHGVTGPSRYLFNYFSPTLIVISVSLFLIMVTVFNQPRAGVIGRWITIAAPATLGIYLMHPALGIALLQAQKRGLVPVWDWTVGSILIATIGVFVICWVATAICQRIPYVRRIVG